MPIGFRRYAPEKCRVEFDGIDLTDLDNFAHGFPHDLFEIHRREAPVWWHPPTVHTPDVVGFWSVATHPLVLEVQRDPVTFSSERGGTLPQNLPGAGTLLNMMDDPRHARIRRLVSSGMTPRMVGRLETLLRARTRDLLAAMSSPVDFLVEVAAELPMQMIGILLGVPASDRHALWEMVDPGFGIRGTEGPHFASSLLDYGTALIASKRAAPTDDMLSLVVHATPGHDDPMSDAELYSFFSLLFAAGSETTRNAIAGGLLALIERPDSSGRCSAIVRGCPSPSRKYSGGPRRRRPSAAPRRGR